MIEILDKANCNGCHACANICPKDCIEMKRDNEGFLYPKIDMNKCIQCGLCEKVCPEIHLKEEKKVEQDGYIIQIKDEEIRRQSTAGGAFTAISKWVLKNNGIVCGVTMDENLKIFHTFVDKEEDLIKFRNSKYVQSTVGSMTFRQIKEYLRQNILVCFSGTPCQIEGLKAYLMKEYDNLITVDVVCRAVPSPLVFEKYIEVQNKQLNSRVKNIKFRDKFYGYKYSTMNVVTTDNNGGYHRGIESDQWLRAFFSEICDRPACHKCSFRKRYRLSDFTIWDCFNVSKFSKDMDDDIGTTRMLIHTQKGKSVFEEIKPEIKYVKIDSDKLVEGVKEMFKSPSANIRRSSFMEDLNKVSAEELFNKYFPNNAKYSIARYIRLTIYHLGIYSFVKRIVHFIKKKG
nr:Coenzyme F420 hydrogenase/dehydrogenase, beta subunit C-terminal domain [Clostridium paraputrificum]